MTEEGRVVNRRDLKRAINSICIVYKGWGAQG